LEQRFQQYTLRQIHGTATYHMVSLLRNIL
jgi:hypothetical protein